MALLLLGAVASAVGATMTAYQTNRERAENAEKQAAAERVLREKTEEIARLNREIAASVTGGSAFPYMSVAGEPGGIPDNPMVTLHNDSGYPLYDLSFRLVDFDEADKLKGRKTVSFEEVLGTVRGVGNVGPKQIVFIGRILPLSMTATRKTFNVFFTARNGSFSQHFQFRRIEGHWQVATKMSRDLPDNKSEPIYERVDPLFPKLPDGSPDW
jgi:hypothetical protein